MPAQHMKAPEQAREDTSPAKIDVTSKSPVGEISVVTLIRTDTTLDHSQKAEKVCYYLASAGMCTYMPCLPTCLLHPQLHLSLTSETLLSTVTLRSILTYVISVGNSSQASCLSRNSAMDDSIGDS